MKTAQLVHKFYFGKGVKISKDTIDIWHKEVLSELVSGKKFSLKASGRSFVFGYIKEDGGIIVREVPNGYTSYEYLLKK